MRMCGTIAPFLPSEIQTAPDESTQIGRYGTGKGKGAHRSRIGLGEERGGTASKPQSNNVIRTERGTPIHLWGSTTVFHRQTPF
jgi:hypothetical protein